MYLSEICVNVIVCDVTNYEIQKGTVVNCCPMYDNSYQTCETVMYIREHMSGVHYVWHIFFSTEVRLYVVPVIIGSLLASERLNRLIKAPLVQWFKGLGTAFCINLQVIDWSLKRLWANINRRLRLLVTKSHAQNHVSCSKIIHSPKRNEWKFLHYGCQVAVTNSKTSPFCQLLTSDDSLTAI